ncbi:hypothetical protein [Staphylococcus simulans]|nr:hypothetical protein [Staphylococcus simulans]
MNKQDGKTYVNQGKSQEATNYTRTGYSNSRLDAHFVCTSLKNVITF